MGLSVFGPSQEQLLRCTEAIAQHAGDAANLVQQLTTAQPPDSPPLNAAALYRSLAGATLSDAPDAVSGGAMFNNQSLVFKVESGAAKVLFTGDMQLTQSQMGAEVTAEIAQLRQAVAADARVKAFDFVKMPHHAATNGFNGDVFQEWNGSVRFGISGGRQDAKHPSPVVLKLLTQLQKKDAALQWARTDRNGLITFGPGDSLTVARGSLNTATPNAGDEGVAAAGRPVSPPPGPTAPAPVAARPSGGAAPPGPGKVSPAADEARVSASFPYRGSRVTLSVNLEPLGKEIEPGVEGPVPQDTSRLPRGRLGGGRSLPKLLFVTSRDALRRNLGTVEADTLLEMITDAGQTLFDALPAGAVAPDNVLGLVRAKIGNDTRGVVLVGGYDVVPAQRLDALDPQLRAAVRGRNGDPFDDYVVWSDAIYGDRDGDGMSELPVSRVPDGKTPMLVWHMFTAGDPATPLPPGCGTCTASTPRSSTLAYRAPRPQI